MSWYPAPDESSVDEKKDDSHLVRDSDDESTVQEEYIDESHLPFHERSGPKTFPFGLNENYLRGIWRTEQAIRELVQNAVDGGFEYAQKKFKAPNLWSLGMGGEWAFRQKAPLKFETYQGSNWAAARI
jgi:hypothetical protein